MLPALTSMFQTKRSLEYALTDFINANLSTPAVTPEQRVTNFFTDVERYVAQQFVNGKIDNNFIVRPTSSGIEVQFTHCGNCSRTTFLLPEELRWSVTKMIPRKVEAAVTSHWDADLDREMYNRYTLNHASPESEDYIAFEAEHNNRPDKYGHITKAEEESYKQVQINGNTWLVLPDETL